MQTTTIEYKMFYGATPEIFKKAKELRKVETGAEKILWMKLCRNQIFGLQFRRQHPINRFIADFYCHKIKLVIEVDGAIHEQAKNKEYDQERSAIFSKFGISVLRFTNSQIMDNIESVIESIKQISQNLSIEAASPPQRGFRG
jgi:very-short-patch-repair endonuclease